MRNNVFTYIYTYSRKLYYTNDNQYIQQHLISALKMRITILCLTLLFSLISASAQALSFNVSYWVDSSQNTSIEEAAKQKFLPTPSQFSLPITEPVSWIKIIIKNDTSRKLELFLHHQTPFFSKEIDIFYFSKARTQHYFSYNLENENSENELVGSSLILPVSLTPSETKILYLRNNALFLNIFKLTLETEKTYVQSLINKSFVENIIVAILISLALYNLTLYFFGERKDHLFYSLYLINAGIGLFYMYGSIYHHFNIYDKLLQWLNITAILVAFFLSFYVKYTFNINKNSGWPNKLLNGVIFLSMANLLIALVFGISLAMQLLPIVFMASFLSLLQSV